MVVPLLGAAGMAGLSLVPRLRPHARYAALAAVVLTTVLILPFRWMKPLTVTLSLWKPTLLFDAPLILQSGGVTQPLAFALAVAACGAILVALSRADDPPLRFVAALLTLLAVGLITLWAANPLTMIVCWAIYDLLQAGAYIAAGGSAQTAVRGFIFGSLATLLLWGGMALPHGETGSELWPSVISSHVQMTLWAGAGILRLWVYPLHLAIPDDLSTTPALAVLVLLSPIAGWGFWLRIASANGGFIAGGTWIPTLAVATLAVGCFLAWSCPLPRSMLPWIGMGANGTALLAVGMAGESAVAAVSAGSVTWVLGMALLFLGDGLQREALWWRLPSIVGALALVGVPLTLGFVMEATLIGGLVKGGFLGWIGAFFVGNLFLILALARWLLSAKKPSSLPNNRWLLAARGIGVGLPALLLILGGLYSPFLISGVRPPSLGALFVRPGLLGWPLWIASLAGGGVLVWQEPNLRPRTELLLSAAHDLLRLDWLYDAVVRALGRGLSVLRAAETVVGGAGALLWSWLLFLILVLAWSSK
jgi:formate hydrogenlyase subunit 3/multisubunit Na+/H+ antiporter MnhD subunit